MEDQGVLLRVITPSGEALGTQCDSVQLYMPDDGNGKNGGWIGIRRGHADALLALAPGTVKVRKDDVVIQEIAIAGGLAFVENNTVTVLADGIQ